MRKQQQSYLGSITENGFKEQKKEEKWATNGPSTKNEFKKVLIDERNMYLTSSLRSAFQPLPNELSPGEFLPTTVVGVVGLGHVAGEKLAYK